LSVRGVIPPPAPVALCALFSLSSCRFLLASCSFFQRSSRSTSLRASQIPGVQVGPCSGQIHSSPPHLAVGTRLVTHRDCSVRIGTFIDAAWSATAPDGGCGRSIIEHIRQSLCGRAPRFVPFRVIAGLSTHEGIRAWATPGRHLTRTEPRVCAELRSRPHYAEARGWHETGWHGGWRRRDPC